MLFLLYSFLLFYVFAYLEAKRISASIWRSVSPHYLFSQPLNHSEPNFKGMAPILLQNTPPHLVTNAAVFIARSSWVRLPSPSYFLLSSTSAVYINFLFPLSLRKLERVMGWASPASFRIKEGSRTFSGWFPHDIPRNLLPLDPRKLFRDSKSDDTLPGDPSRNFVLHTLDAFMIIIRKRTLLLIPPKTLRRADSRNTLQKPSKTHCASPWNTPWVDPKHVTVTFWNALRGP